MEMKELSSNLNQHTNSPQRETGFGLVDGDAVLGEHRQDHLALVL
jgi:hypothetical protein